MADGVQTCGAEVDPFSGGVPGVNADVEVAKYDKEAFAEVELG